MTKSDLQTFLAEIVMEDDYQVVKDYITTLYNDLYKEGGKNLEELFFYEIIDRIEDAKDILKNEMNMAYQEGKVESSYDVDNKLFLSGNDKSKIFGESASTVTKTITLPLLEDTMRKLCRITLQLRQKTEETERLKPFTGISLPKRKRTILRAEPLNTNIDDPIIPSGDNTERLTSFISSKEEYTHYSSEPTKKSAIPDENTNSNRSFATLSDTFKNPDEFGTYIKILLQNDGKYRLVDEDGKWLKEKGNMSVIAAWRKWLMDEEKLYKVSRQEFARLLINYFTGLSISPDARILDPPDKRGKYGTFHKYWDFFKTL